MASAWTPRYVARVASPKTATEVLAYMADFSHAAQWDPSVERAVRADSRAAVAVGSEFDLTVRVGRRVSQMRYRISQLTTTTVQFSARTATLESVDTVTVTPADDGVGCTMEYDARLTFRGIARIANPLLGKTLRTLGDNAAARLKTALLLDGSSRSESSPHP